MKGFLLSAEDLHKRYGEREVVCDVALEVGSGEVIGLLGPNGAGKTT
ncbi:MAG TPA: ATP-binding cassette domain-containing protein, partial [Myxococcota bacterium]|nr:ATP-binding cassette domain-containing protein [Myxococcota bacterium]